MRGGQLGVEVVEMDVRVERDEAWVERLEEGVVREIVLEI